MTLPRFGRITGIQGDVLKLAGYVLSRSSSVSVIPGSDEERISIMKEARAVLVRRTGQDFGYELAAWVAFLEADQQYRSSFTHPYAYRRTLAWIQTAIDDPDRQRLVALIG